VKITYIILMMCFSVLMYSGCALELRKIPSSNQTTATPITTKQLGMSGYGKVFYDANVCDLSFSVVTIADANLAQSFVEHRNKTSKISQFMIRYGGPETICAAKATMLKRSERRLADNRVVEEFQYETDYSCRFTIKEDVGLLQKELIERGVNQITSMELRSSRYNELLKKARDLALEDSRAKVEYIAGLTGWDIVELVDVGLVNENDRSWAYGVRPKTGSRSTIIEDSGSSFETYIDAQINATFLLKRKINK
jgi:uncharacterized protein YggE